jgi:hypothetical protein
MRWCIIVIACLLVLPLVASGVWLYGNDHWPPLLDVAATEMRVRDVGSAHTPLVGLYGRIGPTLDPGNHPGPLSFYLLAPMYRMLGGSYWALEVSTLVLHCMAIVLVVWIARRRAGLPGAMAAGMLLATLELGYGLLVLTEPWIPHLPLLWFVVFLGAVWSVACGDPWLLPLAAASGSLCAQTHLAYLAVCGGLGVFAFVLVTASWARARWHGVGARAPARPVAVAAAVLALLWAPPAIDEVIRRPGNLSIIRDHVLHAPAPPIGRRTALGLMLERLDPVPLVLHAFTDPGVLGGVWAHGEKRRGFVVFVLWIGAAAVATRLGDRSLLAFHAVVAASVVAALLAISRIVGFPWNYLMLWAWAIGATMLLGIVATAARAVWSRTSEPFRRRLAPAGALGVVAIGLCAIRLAATVGVVDWRTARAAAAGWGVRAAVQLDRLAADTAVAIHRGVGASAGDTGRYLVTWDRMSEGLGFVNELERRGLRIGVLKPFGPLTGQHRVLGSDDATARVHLASEGSLSRWRGTTGAVEVAFDDSRTPQDIEESAQLRARVIADLHEQGREDVIAAADREFNGVDLDGVSPWTLMGIHLMRQIGGPAAVFIVPVADSGTK